MARALARACLLVFTVKPEARQKYLENFKKKSSFLLKVNSVVMTKC